MGQGYKPIYRPGFRKEAKITASTGYIDLLEYLKVKIDYIYRGWSLTSKLWTVLILWLLLMPHRQIYPLITEVYVTLYGIPVIWICKIEANNYYIPKIEYESAELHMYILISIGSTGPWLTMHAGRRRRLLLIII
jgi:hypothetical protein